VCNADKRGDIAMKIEQRVHLDGGLVLPEFGPREHRQAQIDGCRVQRVQACIQVDADRIAGIQRPGDGDKDLRKIREDPPVAQLIGVRQRRARHLTPKSHVVEFAADRLEARLNVTQAFAISELSEAHCQKLVPTGKALLLIITAIPAYTLLKLILGKILYELRENRLAKIHPLLSAITRGGHSSQCKRFHFRKTSNRKI